MLLGSIAPTGTPQSSLSVSSFVSPASGSSAPLVTGTFQPSVTGPGTSQISTSVTIELSTPSDSQAPVISPSSLSQPVASATLQVASASSAAAAWAADPNPQTANAAKSATDSALDVAEKLKDLTNDAGLLVVLSQLITSFTAAEIAAVAVAAPSAKTAADVAAALALADAAEAALEAAEGAGGPDSCPVNGKRSTGHSRRLLEARAGGAGIFCLKFTGSVPDPTNKNDVPGNQECDGSKQSLRLSLL